MTIALQALSLLQKAEMVQVRFTHTLLEGPTEYVDAGWILSLHGNLKFHLVNQKNKSTFV